MDDEEFATPNPVCEVRIARTASGKIERRIKGDERATDEIITATVDKHIRGFYYMDAELAKREGCPL